MSSGPSPNVNKAPGVRPYGHVDVGLGKGVGVSNVGAGLVYTPSSAQNAQFYAGASQTRGGSTPFAGKPSTNFGVGARFRF